MCPTSGHRVVSAISMVRLFAQLSNDHEKIKKLITNSNLHISFFLCLTGCEGRKDLLPKNINGWFWSANREKIQPTNRQPIGFSYNPWSQTGHKKVPQPDNAEFDINQTSESCLSVLNNVYNDGIAWHDVGEFRLLSDLTWLMKCLTLSHLSSQTACYHEKPFICEDSDELLNYVAATNPGIRL